MNNENAEVKNEEVTIEMVEYCVPAKVTRLINYNQYLNVSDGKLKEAPLRNSKGLHRTCPFGVVYEGLLEDELNKETFLFPIILSVKDRIDRFKICFNLLNYSDKNFSNIKYVKPAIIATDDKGQIKVVKRGVICFADEK